MQYNRNRGTPARHHVAEHTKRLRRYRHTEKTAHTVGVADSNQINSPAALSFYEAPAFRFFIARETERECPRHRRREEERGRPAGATIALARSLSLSRTLSFPPSLLRAFRVARHEIINNISILFILNSIQKIRNVLQRTPNFEKHNQGGRRQETRAAGRR